MLLLSSSGTPLVVVIHMEYAAKCRRGCGTVSLFLLHNLDDHKKAGVADASRAEPRQRFMMVKVPERSGASPDSADTESLLTSLGTVMGTAPHMSLARTSPRSGRQRVAQGESASPGVCNTTRGNPAQRATARSAMWSRNNRVQSSLCRPLRGLTPSHRCIPRARGLALGYMLSPAARACGFAQTEEVAIVRTQGSRTRPGLHAVARCAGLLET